MIFQNCLKFHRLTAREVTYNKFEISLVVFMPNITTNHAITYTIKIQDGDHVQCRRHSHPAAPHHPQNIPHISCREDQRLPTEGKIISKYCNTSKLKGRSSINTLPPPHPPHVPLWGYDFACTSFKIKCSTHMYCTTLRQEPLGQYQFHKEKKRSYAIHFGSCQYHS